MEDQDGLWKEALEEFFEPFLELLFTDIYQAVDWTQPARFLDNVWSTVLAFGTAFGASSYWISESDKAPC